jgi:hypothetical protein
MVRAELVRRGHSRKVPGGGRAGGGPMPSSSGLSRVPGTKGVDHCRSSCAACVPSARAFVMSLGVEFTSELGYRSGVSPRLRYRQSVWEYGPGPRAPGAILSHRTVAGSGPEVGWAVVGLRCAVYAAPSVWLTLGTVRPCSRSLVPGPTRLEQFGRAGQWRAPGRILDFGL